MERWGSRFSKLSPLGYALVLFVFSSIGFGLVFALKRSSEMRTGAVPFLVVVSVAAAGLGYWGRRRELAGAPRDFLPKQSPAVAALVAFLLATMFGASYAYFLDPTKNALLHGAFWGTLAGLLTYRARRGVKYSFRSFVALYFPLLVVYIVISIFLDSLQ